MMRWFCLLLMVTSCGGNGGGNGTGNTATNGEGVPIIEDICDSIPIFDLDGKSCDQVAAAFQSTMSAMTVCNTDLDCLVVSGTCETFTDAFCSYPINTCAAEVEGNAIQGQGIVSAFAARWAGCPRGHGCQGCPAVTAVCVSNECVFAE